jgi:hypothetical protein
VLRFVRSRSVSFFFFLHRAAMPVPETTAAAGPPGMSADPNAPADAARLEWLWSEYEAQMAEQRAYAEQGMDIFPSPGMVLKTALLTPPARPSPQFPPLTPAQASARPKFFVNLCSDPALSLPKLEPDGQGGEHLRVPISAGPVTWGIEKDGETACLMTDLVLNPETVSRASSDKEFRDFIAQFALQKVEQKFACKLATEEVKWPKMKYKGTLPPKSQHIRRPKGAHIEPEDPHAAARSASAAGSDADSLPSEEALEERRRAAAAARIEALRAMEERESGIVMGKSSSSANNSGTAGAGATGAVFTTSEAAEAAAQAELAQTPAERRLAAVAAAAKPSAAKIEVLKDEPAAASSSSAAAAKSSAAASSVSAKAGVPAAASSSGAPSAAASSSSSSSSSSLPEHSIFYLKNSLGADAVAVPAAEWDLSSTDDGDADEEQLPLPAGVRVLVVLPLLSRAGAAELEVVVTRDGLVSLASTAECVAQGLHQYQLSMTFPFFLDDERAECKFSKKNRTLTLTLPVTGLKPLPDVEPAPVASAAAFASSAPQQQPAVDWKAKLGLTNTLMYELVSES